MIHVTVSPDDYYTQLEQIEMSELKQMAVQAEIITALQTRLTQALESSDAESADLLILAQALEAATAAYKNIRGNRGVN
jgi:hypothetical protein